MRERERELHAEEGRQPVSPMSIISNGLASASEDVVAIVSLCFGSFEIFINPVTLRGNQ